jgi:hypothetical protein
MKKLAVLLAVAAALLILRSAVYADYSVADTGLWPDSWPKELEPLRKQARTYVGPLLPARRYLIPFTKREEFEAAWPHLLKARSKGAPIILVRGPKTDFFAVKPAGVLIYSPPADTDKAANPELPRPGDMDVRTKWSNTTYIELAVDGDIVNLNRIPLPSDGPVIDERFKEEGKK